MNKPAQTSLSPSSPASDVVLAYLRAQVVTLRERESELWAHDPDAVHRTRVASRRLRTTLRVFRRLLHRDRSDPIRDELRWYAGRLGAVRDLDVVHALLLETLADLPAADREPVRERLGTTLGRAHDQACSRLEETLDSQRYADLVDTLAALCADPPWRGRAHRPAKKVLPDLVEEATARVERTRARARAARDPDARRTLRHETRKKAKAVRYAHETLALARGAPARKQAKRWKEVTEELGADQDRVTAQLWVQRTSEAAAAAGEDTVPFARLARLVAREVDQQA